MNLVSNKNKPNLGLDGKEKPCFKEGDKVWFDYDGSTKGAGFIRGKASSHLLDFWIVEVDVSNNIDQNLYPWSCITVPHSCLKAI